jgi:hypothetical protein
MTTATESKSLMSRMYDADLDLLDGMLEEHNDEAIEADDFRYACPDCGKLALADDPEDDEDATCDACHTATHFTCSTCHEECRLEDRDDRYPTLCSSCGDDHHNGLCEAYRDEIASVLDGWGEDEDELAKLKKVLAYAKRFK